MARTMTLNDGTVLTLKMCGVDEEEGTMSFVPTDAVPLPALVTLLCDPAATGVITVRGVEMEDRYEGYTELVFLSRLLYKEGPYFILRKGET